ncbi:hypothetical protein O3P69_003035 [Scylla paramamosain]|uniref:Uncharacterized protein n=1 Tax=Scylla paramamosain TaxID=85552 RepID=A0AAW0UPF4_SCYPA
MCSAAESLQGGRDHVDHFQQLSSLLITREVAALCCGRWRANSCPGGLFPLAADSWLRRYQASTPWKFPSNTLAQWSNKFLAFLRDSKYDGPDAKMKTHNFTNIYNLLFVSGERHEEHGDPPSPDAVIQYMINQGLLVKEGEFLRVSHSS